MTPHDDARQTITSTHAQPAVSADRVGHAELHGIDVIPESERHGQPRELFWIWGAANLAFINILLGGLMIVIGLNLWQSILAVVVGNLFYILIGWAGIPGPNAGTSGIMIS